MLDLTIDRLSQAVNYINKRLKARFLETARLLETAVRYIAAFSAQSKEGAKAAGEIKLIDTDDDGPKLPENYPQESPKGEDKKLVLPPGVKDPRAEMSEEDKKRKEPKEVRSLRFEATVGELPDAEDRKVKLDRPEDQLNKPGSFEAIMSRFAGQMKGS